MFEFEALPIALATVSAFVLGFWLYSPFGLGKPWAKALGFDINEKVPGKQMGINVGLMVQGAAFTGFVFEGTHQAFLPNTYYHDWQGLTALLALEGAFFVWLGFIVPIMFAKVTWERRPWTIFFVDAGYYLVNLVVISMIFLAFLGGWRLRSVAASGLIIGNSDFIGISTKRYRSGWSLTSKVTG